MTQIDKLFDKTKGNLFFKKGAGFLGSLLFNLDFQWMEAGHPVYDQMVNQGMMPTAATDGLSLFWNPEFFMALDQETRITVLAHELWHVGYMHLICRGDRDPIIWNIACDHVVNLMLEEQGYFMSGFPYIMDPKYRGWATEDVYKDIYDDSDSACPEGMGLDVLEPKGQEELDAAVSKVASAVATARITNSAGDIPGEITLTLENFLNPKLPWETILMNFMSDLSQPERSYRRFNRRYDDPLLPGENPTSGLEHLIFYLDISGSVTDDQILRFNSEVKFIQEVLCPERLTLVTFDTHIRDVYEFEIDQPFSKITVTGRGGTSIFPVMEHAKKNSPTAVVIFTDLEFPFSNDPVSCPIIWVCVDNPHKIVPYGRLIHFSEVTGYKFGKAANPAGFVPTHETIGYEGI